MAIGQGEMTVCNGTHKIEDSRLHPAKVRVKFIESQPLAQVLACPSSTPSSPDVTLDLSTSDAMTSPTSDSYARQISAESGVDNPFRPDGELSREADTIVSLIKEGKPIITSIKTEENMVDGSVVANGHASDANTDSVTASPVKEAVITPTDANAAKVEAKSGANGSAPKGSYSNNAAAPGVIEVRHSVISPPAETPQVEQVTIKKKSKSSCCVIQ